MPVEKIQVLHSDTDSALYFGEGSYGSRSLSVRFDGTQNVAFDGVCQYVPVDPRTSYQFSAWIRAEFSVELEAIFQSL